MGSKKAHQYTVHIIYLTAKTELVENEDVDNQKVENTNIVPYFPIAC